MTINGFKSEKAITVYKGTLSFRIVNKSSKFFECLTYIDNYSSSVTRFLVDSKSETDTIYGWSSTYNQKMHIFGVSFFINNSEYTFPEFLWIEDFKHTDIIVSDTTKIVPRSGITFPNGVMIKDL